MRPASSGMSGWDGYEVKNNRDQEAGLHFSTLLSPSLYDPRIGHLTFAYQLIPCEMRELHHIISNFPPNSRIYDPKGLILESGCRKKKKGID